MFSALNLPFLYLFNYSFVYVPDFSRLPRLPIPTRPRLRRRRPISRLRTLSLEALQPTRQRIREKLPADRAARKRRPEIKTVLRVREDVAKQLVLTRRLTALRWWAAE